MSLHCFILSAAIISDFGHIPVLHSHSPSVQCVCLWVCVSVCVFQLLAGLQLNNCLFFPLLCVCACMGMCICWGIQLKTTPLLKLCVLFFCIILRPGQNPSGCMWFQSVPVITAGQRAATASSPLTPLCWTLFCLVALHLISLCLLSNSLDSYLYLYVFRDESAGCECVQPFVPE